tara:strand:+ start:16 stop:720 length:705 start_codon:yes stop_codon:yes gene_type:complete
MKKSIVNSFLKKNHFLALIPAKGKSISIKKKNLQKIKGKSLIDITIENSKKTKYLKEIYVSSEDREILKISKSKGVNPIIRPKYLSKAQSKMIDVIIHAVKSIPIKNKNTFLVLLQPTSPFRNYKHIDKAIESMILNKKKSLISLVKSDFCIFKSVKINKAIIEPVFANKFLSSNRQNFPETYIPNGAIYIFPVNSIKRKTRSLVNKSFMPFVMNKKESLDIDNKQDLIYANNE